MIHPYSYRPDRLLFLGHGMSLGWELEIDNINLKYDNETTSNVVEECSKVKMDKQTVPILYCKLDSSVPHGIELVSHPMDWPHLKVTLPKLKKHNVKRVTFTCCLRKLFNKLKAMGYGCNGNSPCGLHVHISRAGMIFRESKRQLIKIGEVDQGVNGVTPLTILKLLRLMNASLPFITAISRRKNVDAINTYAAVDEPQSCEESLNWATWHKSLIQKYIEIENGLTRNSTFWHRRGKLSFDIHNKVEVRRTALNCVPDTTIEFRFFNGTLNFDAFYTALEFVVAIKDYCEASSLQNFVGCHYRDTMCRKFVEYVLGYPEYSDRLKRHVHAGFLTAYPKGQLTTDWKPKKDAPKEVVEVVKKEEEVSA